MSDSSKGKPPKPYPGFPLFAHASGRWCKKIRGKFVYFGKWDDWQGALKKYQEQRDYLHAGLKPRDTTAGVTIELLMNHFLTVQTRKLELKEIATRTFRDYRNTCDRIVDHFGRSRVITDITPDEFDKLRNKLSTTRNVRTLGNEVNRIRIAFKHAHDAGLVAEKIKFSKQFAQPTKAVLRKHRARQGKKMFTPAEVRTLILNANAPMAAMILLGLNCGFGPSDCATITFDYLDLDRGWHDYHRPKTAIERTCPLWPETIEAICDALEKRPREIAQENENLVFVTRHGNPYVTPDDSPCSKEFAKLAKRVGINGTFYWLRHVFETVGGESRDQVAVDHIMGHSQPSMAGEYREAISPERLQRVVDTVRNWVNFDASIELDNVAEPGV